MKIIKTTIRTGIAKIYTLSDYKGNVFYVGCTIQKLQYRLYAHLYCAKNGTHNKAKAALIKSLDYKIIIKEVDRVEVTGKNGWSMKFDARVLEREWVKKYIDMGHKLTNYQLLKSA